MPVDIEKELVEYLGQEYISLSAPNKSKLSQLYKKYRRGDAIYFWWFFNFHYAYVKKWKLCVLFVLTFGAIGVWWLIDLFRLNTILREYNVTKAKELLKNLNQ